MRSPEVFVRALEHGEATALKSRAKKAKYFAARERAAILLASNVGNSAPQIAAMWMTDESYVRKVIHEFNERGMASLDPDYRGGRPRRITTEQRRQAVAVAGARPDSQGAPLTRWSLPRLADHLAEQGIVEISAAHLGRVLADAGLSFHRTRTWKASPDPDYESPSTAEPGRSAEPDNALDIYRNVGGTPHGSLEPNLAAVPSRRSNRPSNGAVERVQHS